MTNLPEISHDRLGYYLCIQHEPANDKTGNEPLGIDGRRHYRTMREAKEALQQYKHFVMSRD
jgi:hypothetical protein